MRLTSTQLRNIIAEEVARVKGRRRLTEAAAVDMSNFVDTDSVVEELGAAFYDTASAAFDEDDPSMAALGEDAWNAQVDQATEAFKNAVAAALTSAKSAVSNAKASVMSKLFDGEYV